MHFARNYALANWEVATLGPGGGHMGVSAILSQAAAEGVVQEAERERRRREEVRSTLMNVVLPKAAPA